MLSAAGSPNRAVRSHIAVGGSFSANQTLMSADVRYKRMRPGMTAMAKPSPEPGNWKKASAASKRAKPAMIIVAVRAQGWSAQRPTATSIQAMPVASASQPQSPMSSYSGRSPNAPNQSKPSTLKPKKRKLNPASPAKKPRTEMRMGGFFTVASIGLRRLSDHAHDGRQRYHAGAVQTN